MIMLQSDLTRTRFITPVLWLLISMPVINAWPVVRQSKNLNLDHYAVGLTGWKGLMAGVVFQAWVEASAGDPEALEWLAGDDCFDHCFVIGFNHEIVKSWVEKTRKEWRKMDMKVFEIKRRLCDRLGLPLMVADMLRGETTEAIKEDAEKLIKLINPYAIYIDIVKEKQT